LTSMPNMKTEGLQKLRWFHFLALVSASVLLISLIYPTPIKNKYPILISVGVLLYSLVEWNEWGYAVQISATAKISIPQKFPTRISRILKLIAIGLIIATLVELVLNIEFIPFPK